MIEDFILLVTHQGILAGLRPLGLTPDKLMLFGVGLGMLIFVIGLAGAFSGVTPAGRRMVLPDGRAARANFDLVRGGEDSPSGLLKAFIPTSRQERSRVARSLRQAGILRPDAVRRYFLIRTMLAIVLPLFLIGFFVMPSDIAGQAGLEALRLKLTGPLLLQGVTGLIVLGFYGPAAWLRSRVTARREAIRLSMPNTLDLLQVAVEAGLGFDAAMTRVSHELARVSPAISEEFMMLQLELQAGKDRDRAFFDMADRIGLEEVKSFVSVILQSAQFGSSVSQALSTYAHEMRLLRELKAQEKANKLPVKMSAVLAAMMMPTLLLICLTPVAIRWVRMSEGG